MTIIEQRGDQRTVNIIMKTLTKLSAAVVVTVALLAIAGCGKKQEAASTVTHETSAVPVQVVPSLRGGISVTKTFSASLEGEEQANIVAKISERITSIKTHVGESTTSGQIVIALDKSGTTSQYFQAEAGFKNADKTLQRMKSLYGEGAISLQQLDGAQTSYDVAKANFDAARSAVELTTPISGVVTALNVSVGDLTQPGAVLATIARVNKMKAIFSMNEDDAAGMSIGQKVKVYTEAKAGVKTEGRIVQISRSADVRSRTFEIKAMLENTRDLWFKPGMYCKVDIQSAPKLNAILVQNASLVSDGVNTYVYAIQNKRALRRNVVPGVTDGERTEIVSGLGEGESIVTVGATSLKDSSEVAAVGTK